MRVSYGRNSLDTHPIILEPDDLGVLGAVLLDQRVARPPAQKNFGCPFIAPFILHPNVVGKTVNNVAACGSWFGMDIDHGWTMSTLLARFEGVRSLCYTTTAHTPENPRLRFLVEVTREYSPVEYAALWYAFDDLLDGHLDPSTKNVNRLLFVPALWLGRTNEFVMQAGTPLDVDALIASIPLPQVPQPPKRPISTVAGVPIASKHLVTVNMIARFQAASEGGRFFRLLCDISVHALSMGWQTSADDIEQAALQVDSLLTRKKRHGTHREAVTALTWASTVIAPVTQLERIRNRLLYRKMKKEHSRG